MNTVPCPNASSASACDRSRASSSSSGPATFRMPRPPPPAVALTINGYPMVSAWRRGVGQARHRATTPCSHGHAGLLGEHLGADLVAKPAHHVRGRADEEHAEASTQLGKRGVFGDEPPSHPDRVGAGGAQRPFELAVVEVRRRSLAAAAFVRGSDADRLVGFAHEHGAALRLRVERDGADIRRRLGVPLADRVDQPHRRLAAIHDHDPPELLRHAPTLPHTRRSLVQAMSSPPLL